MCELLDSYVPHAVIKVIGVGSGGCNAVQHMVDGNIEGVDFICLNTDAHALKGISARTTLQIGSTITKGLGAGANPDIGRQAAHEDRQRITEVIKGADMLFITAGMGGGTGTGAAPVVAQVARELGILTVAVVTKPFPFEGSKRLHVAHNGIEELSQYVDSLITIPNEKLLLLLGKQISLLDAFKAANDVLLGAVQGIAELITRPGLIYVDFADLRTVMSEMGITMMGMGCAKGEDRAREATEAAITSPLLEDVNLMGAHGILVNVTADMDMGIGEFEVVGNTVRAFASENATVVVGTVINSELRDELRVTIFAFSPDRKNINNIYEHRKSENANKEGYGENRLHSVSHRSATREPSAKVVNSDIDLDTMPGGSRINTDVSAHSDKKTKLEVRSVKQNPNIPMLKYKYVNSVPNCVFLGLKGDITSATGIKLHATVNFSEWTAALLGGKVRYSIKRAELKFQMHSCHMPYDSRVIPNKLVMSTERQRDVSFGLVSKDEKEIVDSLSAELSFQKVKGAFGTNTKRMSALENSDNLRETFKFHRGQIATGGAETTPQWTFHALKGDLYLTGAIKNVFLGDVVIDDLPANIEGQLSVCRREINVTGTEGIWPSDMSKNRNAVFRILAIKFFMDSSKPYLSSEIIDIISST